MSNQDRDKTIIDVWNTLNEEQRRVAEYLIYQALYSNPDTIRYIGRG